jgi:hypothetical protein
VAGEHDAQPSPWIDHGEDVAVAVGAEFVGIRPCPGADYFLNLMLEAGCARCEKELFEER